MVSFRRKRHRWHVRWAFKEWERWRRHQDALDDQSSDSDDDDEFFVPAAGAAANGAAPSSSSSSSSDDDDDVDDVSDSGSDGSVRVFVFEGNAKARHVSPFSPLGRERAASAESAQAANGAAAADDSTTPPATAPRRDAAAPTPDDSDDDFADGPAKKPATADSDDSDDDFADGPAKKKPANDDDSDDDVEDAPEPAKPASQTAQLLGDFPDNMDESDDESDDDDWEDEDGPEPPESTWLLDVAAPFASVFASPARAKVCLAYSDSMTRHHERSTDHPERPERITMSHAELGAAGLLDACATLPSRRATPKELRRVHESSYVAATFALKAKCDAALESGDDDAVARLRQDVAELANRQNSVYLNEHSVDCALLSAGGTVDAVMAVASGRFDHGCALVRPPGHHAECHCMMGFCLYNNVAVAVAAALEDEKRPCRRVLVVDWDVHHGNGTQNMFFDDPRVLFCSIHRYDRGTFYPPGDGGGPQQLIVVSAGFDSARGDPLGGCDLTPRGYARLLDRLKGLRPSRGVALCLEGGYNCLSVARSYSACVGGLQGATPPDDSDLKKPSLRALKAVAATANHLLPHWPKLKKAAEMCNKAYAKAHKKHLAKRAEEPRPQFGRDPDRDPGFGWAY
ncbi:NAD-dependent histone deacetylase [Aureococcus anophagefferens]|nr:NAD-dependent histone deacetylase [Aureococcus anophagefferens]